MAQRNDHSIVPLRPIEVAPLSRSTQIRLDYSDTARTVREDFVRDAAQEAACGEALGLTPAWREAAKGGLG